MNIFQLLNNLYVNKQTDWIIGIDESEIQPYVINQFLAMNDNVRVQCRWLDKYVFTLPPRMWLSLAWSVLPKYQKMPFVRYIKKVEELQEFDFILNEIRKQFKLSDNDFRTNKTRLINAIKNDMSGWFKYYGVPKKYWKQFHLDYDIIKVEENKRQIPLKGLGAWGI